MKLAQSTHARPRVVIVGPVIEWIGGEGVGLVKAGAAKVGKVNVGEERWMAMYSRFSSRGLDDSADRVLSVQREEFGGHAEEATG